MALATTPNGSRDRFSGALSMAVRFVFWAVVWVLLWKLAAILAVAYGISAWYPPAAISFYLLVRFGPQYCWVPFLASLFAGTEIWSDAPTSHELAGSLSHAVAYAAGAWLYRRLTGTYAHSIRKKTLVSLCLCAALSALAASVLGNINHAVAGGPEGKVTLNGIIGWFLGDYFGVLSLAPFLILCMTSLSFWKYRSFRGMAPVNNALLASACAAAFGYVIYFVSVESALRYTTTVIVGTGFLSLLLAYALSPHAAVLFVSLISLLAAFWLSTEFDPGLRVEFAFQMCLFLIIAYYGIGMMQETRREKARNTVKSVNLATARREQEMSQASLEKVKSRVSRLAHEVRSPLNAIIGFAELSEQSLGRGKKAEKSTEYLHIVNQAARYLSYLVDDAFDRAKLDHGGIDAKMEIFSVHSALVELMETMTHNTGGRCRFHNLADVEGVYVRSDRRRLFQILINIMNNALAYSPKGSDVLVGFEVSGEEVLITVENRNETATREEIEAHLDGDKTGSSGDGLGLGLPLVKRLASAINARLSVAVQSQAVRFTVAIDRA